MVRCVRKEVGVLSCNSEVVRVLRSLYVAESVALKMILKVLLVFLFAAIANSEPYEGDTCNLTNGSPGLCAFLNKCTSVFEELQRGNAPDKLCGYIGFDPVVCCPTSTPTTSQPTPTNPFTVNRGDGRGEIARQKCQSYSKFVYTTKWPPILLPGQRPLNVSECAIKSQKLVVGGTKAERMEFPHMVAVGYDLSDGEIGWYCGGTLISEYYVLTAAHCTYSVDWGDATWARVGDLNLKRTDDGARPVNIAIADRIRHPEYKPPSQYHDIALLRLQNRVNFNGWVRPACLHTAASTGTEKAIATGWGRVDWADDEGSSDLLKVTLPLVGAKSCNASYTTGSTDIKLRNGIVGEWSICAGEPGKDTCQGDSGGPLVIFDTQQYCMYDIIGITSLGRLCNSPVPGVYTRIYHYVPWIEQKVWGQG